MSVQEHHTGSDRIAEAVANLDVDIIVNVQGDEPFTDRRSLESVLEVFKDDHQKEIDLASLMTRISDWDEIKNPNTVKVVVNKDNFALYFSRSPIPFPRADDLEITYFKHKGIYAFRKEALMDFRRLPMLHLEAAEKIEAIRYLEYGKKIKMVETEASGIEIDTPEDLKRAKEAWS
jgi:3-deoxy-manno-octulosonate cytidylyltransferase (CMP-KDO synthetase)